MAAVESVDDHSAYLEASGAGALVQEVASALLDVRPPEPMWLSFVVQHFADKAEPPPALGRAYLKLAQAAATGCANHDAALDVMASAYDCFAKERSCGGPCATDYTALLAALLDPFEVVDKEAQETNEGSNINSNSDKSTVDRLQTLLVPRSMAKSLAAAQARKTAAAARRQTTSERVSCASTTASNTAAAVTATATALTTTATAVKETRTQNTSSSSSLVELATAPTNGEEALVNSDLQNDNDSNNNEDTFWPEPPPEAVPFSIFASGLGALLRCLRLLHEARNVWQRVFEEETPNSNDSRSSSSNGSTGAVAKVVPLRDLITAFSPWDGPDVGASGVAFAPSLKVNVSDLISALAVAATTTTTTSDATSGGDDGAANARKERLKYWVMADDSSSQSADELNDQAECSARDVDLACAAACERALRDLAGGAFMWTP